ncbi:MAG: phytanoyl-CoA dioxygenase family protein [Kiritimatiellae bacterium]|nr:phytanoyl-CoA dioxygenase family protein [Kiritimatiellia bacterium]
MKHLSMEEKSRMERDGFHIARALFNTEEISEIRRVFQEQGDSGVTPGLQNDDRLQSNEALAKYPRMMMPHRHADLPVGPVSLSAMLDPRIGDILHDLYGEAAVAAQSMFYFKPPQARGQGLHQDNFYLKVAPANCMAAWVAVDDADEDNGGLMVIPGSHKLGLVCPEQADPTVSFTTEHIPTPEGMQVVPVIMKAGDVLFFTGSLIHGSYPNTSDTRSRRALIFHYGPASMKEISGHYKPLLDFEQHELDGVLAATGGGPCGTEFVAVGSA